MTEIKRLVRFSIPEGIRRFMDPASSELSRSNDAWPVLLNVVVSSNFLFLTVFLGAWPEFLIFIVLSLMLGVELNMVVDLKLFLSSSGYDFVAISETWLHENDDGVVLVGGTDFQVYLCDRVDDDRSRGGGVALFASNSVGSAVVDTRNFPSGCGLLCVDFIAKINFRFIVIYCPPNCPAPETKLFLDSIADCTFVVVDDFNFDFTFFYSHRDDFAGVNFLFHHFA